MKSLKCHKCLTITTIRNKTKAQYCSSFPACAASINADKLTKSETSVGVLHVWNCRYFQPTCLHKEEIRQIITYEVTWWDVGLTFIPPRISQHFIRIYVAGSNDFLVIMFLKRKSVVMETDQRDSLVRYTYIYISSKTCFTLRRTERDIIHVYWSSCKVPIILVRF